jgi:hypothetical protein
MKPKVPIALIIRDENDHVGARCDTLKRLLAKGHKQHQQASHLPPPY